MCMCEEKKKKETKKCDRNSPSLFSLDGFHEWNGVGRHQVLLPAIQRHY